MSENGKITYNVQKIGEGIWAIDEFSMDYVYVIEGKERAVLIDTGTGTWDLRSVVEKLVSKPYDVWITHAHMDHVGGIGQFDTIHIHKDEIPYFSLEGRDNPTSIIERQLYSERAVAAHGAEQLPFDVKALKPVDLSRISFVPFQEGDVLDLGGRTLEVLRIKGHTVGSCCFLLREDRILFAGDNFGKILILMLGGDDRQQAAIWRESAKTVERRVKEFDTIYAGHFCPLPWEYFYDMLEGAQRLADGELPLEMLSVDELIGPMYKFKEIYYTLDPENLLTRDYHRIKNPRHY